MDFFDDIVQQKPTKQYYFNQIKNQLANNYLQLENQQQKTVDQIITSLMQLKNKKQLQKYMQLRCFQKLPSLRIHLWKIMLQNLPINYQEWQKTKQNNQKSYKTILQRLFPSYLDQQDLLDIGSDTKNIIDQQLWHSITLDTKRTHSALGYFQKQCKFTKLYISKPTKHADVLTRILYIWALTNPTVKYVQGMNQILAPIYYLQYYNQTKQSQSQVFFAFCRIITFLIDMHIKQMDDFQHGIMGRILTLNKYLKVVDIQLWTRLQAQGIYPQFYSFRWLALLLAQQFQITDTIQLWDFMLSYDGYRRFFYLYSCCLAILLIRKQFIMKNQFVEALPCLQKLRDVKIKKVIKLANKIYDKYSRIDMEKLYQKIQNANNQQGIIKKIEQKKQKEKNIKGWSYGQLLKNTSNYLSKIYQKKNN